MIGNGRRGWLLRGRRRLKQFERGKGCWEYQYRNHAVHLRALGYVGESFDFA